MPNFEKVREQIKQITQEQKLELIRLCNIENNKSKDNEYLNQLSNNHHCQHCGSNKICKNGSNHSKSVRIQKFRCNACHKNYTIKTNTIFYYTHKSIEIWQEYIELFSQGLSLRKIVEKMNKKINLKTAFFWRHKILKVLTQKDGNNKLGGIVEADETFFEESQKGSRKMTRKARKRGFSSENRQVGLSYNKVCVLTALDRQKHSFNKPVGYGKVCKEQIGILQHRIEKDSILIIDGNRTYRNLHDVRLKSLKFGKPQSKLYHLNTINSFHSHLKKFMIRFNGVATKYLDYYVEYFKNIKDNIDIFAILLNNAVYCRNVDVKNKRICFESMVNY